MKLNVNSPLEIPAAAAQLSLDNPGMYVTVVVDFDVVFARISKSLGTFAPTDSWGDHYWLNGQAKPFTSKQRAADWAASPTMS